MIVCVLLLLARANSFAFQGKSLSPNKTFALTIFGRNLRKSHSLSSAFSRTTQLQMSTRAEIDRLIAENKVMVFSKSYCPYCTRAKEAIRGQGVAFHAIELDVSNTCLKLKLC